MADIKSAVAQLIIEGYARITDKEPLYVFKETTMNMAVNLAEVMLEGKEVTFVVIADAETDVVLRELKK